MIPAYLVPLANHLWQSTLVTVAVWLLAGTLKKNRAGLRHALWLAASLRFLVPFSILVDLGNALASNAPKPVGPPAVVRVALPVAQPFAVPAVHPLVAPAPRARDPLPFALGILWAAGVAVTLTSWNVRSRSLRSAARAASPTTIAGLPVLVSGTNVGPGVFGIFRPVLLVPAGPAERLTPLELSAVIEHERGHLRRRDNLLAAFHMTVEAFFWFYPLVWWIGKQLRDERERAYDEEVLSSGADPESCAQVILKVCRLYLESPLACAAGVTGADLKLRIERIMQGAMSQTLNAGKKLLLSAAAIAVIAAPVTVGIMSGPRLLAQTKKPSFEVASVKVLNGNLRQAGPYYRFLPGGKFSAHAVQLWFIIVDAYGVPIQSDRMTGGPDWLRSMVVDIEATAPAGSIPADALGVVRAAKMRLMIQSLLADRFKMKIRREVAERPVYFVTVSKGGPKLHKSEKNERDCFDSTGAVFSDGCHAFQGGQGRGVHTEAATIADMAAYVGNWADRPVIDKTGLTGLYNIQTEGWAQMRPRPPRPPDQEPTEEDRRFADPSTPTLFVVFDRLGLKLESAKAPVESFVIESAERPTAN